MAENPILNDRYRLIEQIGSGGMAVIYRAQDMELGRVVSVKILRPSLVDDPEFLIRFRREAQAAANLNHPNIVAVYDVGQDGPKTHYIVMEHVPGQDLKRMLRARGAFDVDAALAIIIEVCKGVGYAHRAGLVHCDVKPQNILITPDNTVKVTDFGIARALSAAQPQPDQVEDVVWGSPHYFSPEQAAGEGCTPSSDVYSIGIVLFELLTGQLPFGGKEYRDLAMAHLKQPAPLVTSVNPALPQDLDRIIQKVLAKEPSARYRTADQLGRILEKYRQQGQQATSSFRVSPSAASAPPPPQPEQTLKHQPARGPERTVPSLPPVDIDAYMGRPAPAPTQPAYSYQDDFEDDYVEYPQDIVPGIDLYGLVLGVLAAVAVLGLIPLWLTVYYTLAR
jgi:serine/threonine-protein kinase